MVLIELDIDFGFEVIGMFKLMFFIFGMLKEVW